MYSIYKYFLILVSPLIISYLAPLIVYKNSRIGTFLEGEYHRRVDLYFSDTDVVITFLIIFLWILISLFTIYLILSIKNFFLNNKSPDIEKKINYSNFLSIFLFLFIAGNSIAIVHNFYIFPGPFEELVHQLSLMPIFLAGLGFFIINEDKITKKQSIIVYILILLSIINGLSLYIVSSRAAYVLYFMISFALILDCYSRNYKLKIILIAIIILTIPFLMTFKVYIRNNFYENGITRINIMDFQNKKIFVSSKYSQNKKDLKSEIVEFYNYDNLNHGNLRFQFLKEDNYLSYVIRRAAARSDHLGITNYYYSIFPSEYPYLGSAYLEKIFLGIVPRMMWADKPKNDSANTLPILTKLLPPYDRTTSFNLNIIEEGIAFQGVLGVMAVGVIYSSIIALTFVVANLFGKLFFILMPLSAFTLLNTESGLYGIFNGVLHTIFIYLLILFLVKFFIKK